MDGDRPLKAVTERAADTYARRLLASLDAAASSSPAARPSLASSLARAAAASVSTSPLSPVLLRRRRAAARAPGLAADGQWRFPRGRDASRERFSEVLVRFEDRRFFAHPGVDPLAVARARASEHPARAGSSSGGSTITMQVVRLARKNRPPHLAWKSCARSCWPCASRRRLSKDEILDLYAAHAPFGGNVVGHRRGRLALLRPQPGRALSWAEAAFLAVLPNDPGAHRQRRRAGRSCAAKRDRLAAAGCETRETIAVLECRLALAEPMPDRVRGPCRG
ncbi:MAG: transglycosylase domain-containing protein [Ignavibacteriales bacterium]|nr:transglycosylase domain-containing protein [Ignavibacteriales bacterium]